MKLLKRSLTNNRTVRLNVYSTRHWFYYRFEVRVNGTAAESFPGIALNYGRIFSNPLRTKSKNLISVCMSAALHKALWVILGLEQSEHVLKVILQLWIAGSRLNTLTVGVHLWIIILIIFFGEITSLVTSIDRICYIRPIQLPDVMPNREASGQAIEVSTDLAIGLLRTSSCWVVWRSYFWLLINWHVISSVDFI